MVSATSGENLTAPAEMPVLPEYCEAALDKFSMCLFGSPRHAVTERALCHATYSTLWKCLAAAEIESESTLLVEPY